MQGSPEMGREGWLALGLGVWGQAVKKPQLTALQASQLLLGEFE